MHEENKYLTLKQSFIQDLIYIQSQELQLQMKRFAKEYANSMILVTYLVSLLY